MTGRTLCAARIDFPNDWRATVSAALRATGGIRPAARQLDVSAVTLHRWLRDYPALADGITLDPSRNPAFKRKRAVT